jgi:hypothetical protein
MYDKNGIFLRGDKMSENNKQADAIKRILEQKKAKQGNAQQGYQGTDPKKMKTQIKKVQNNQKRRTGV